MASPAELTCVSRWWWEQKPLILKQKILLTRCCGAVQELHDKEVAIFNHLIVHHGKQAGI